MQDILHEWNDPTTTFGVHDETLRDGLQSPTAHDPNLSDKLTIVRQLAATGVVSAGIGLPAAGTRMRAHCREIVRMIGQERLALQPCCAARTLSEDIEPIVDITQETGVPIQVMAFVGTSPIRLFAEGWDEAHVERLVQSTVAWVTGQGLPVALVTEDTTRSKPALLERVFGAAIDAGVNRLVLCDTVGHATPSGTHRLVSHVRSWLQREGHDHIQLDWHGHNDRGLSLANALAAAAAGVHRIHGTVLGIGERVGNTPTDQLLLHQHLQDEEGDALRSLRPLVEQVSHALKWPIPPNYPVFGQDAFRTATGVHASAMRKAAQRGSSWLEDRIYSGVPARWFGHEHRIEISHQSGQANVRHWLATHGFDETGPLVTRIHQAAKSQTHPLTDAQIVALIESNS